MKRIEIVSKVLQINDTIYTAQLEAQLDIGYVDDFVPNIPSEKIITELINYDFLGSGAHKCCFVNNKKTKVISIFHGEFEEELSPVLHQFDSKIWPKINYLESQVISMPYYKIISTDNLNTVQSNIYRELRRIYYIDTTIDYSDFDLPKYIIDGLNMALDYGHLVNDIAWDNIGWIGNCPVFFDGFYYD